MKKYGCKKLNIYFFFLSFYLFIVRLKARVENLRFLILFFFCTSLISFHTNFTANLIFLKNIFEYKHLKSEFLTSLFLTFHGWCVSVCQRKKNFRQEVEKLDRRLWGRKVSKHWHVERCMKVSAAKNTKITKTIINL